MGIAHHLRDGTQVAAQHGFAILQRLHRRITESLKIGRIQQRMSMCQCLLVIAIGEERYNC